MEDDSEVSDDEFNEKAKLSYDQFELRHSHNLRNNSDSQYSSQSYDSRFSPGNRAYEADDFVVDDDDSIEEESDTGSDWDSDLDLDINMERDPVRATYRNVSRPVRLESLFSDSSRRTSGATQSSRSTRHPSATSSKLFFSDPAGSTPRIRPYLSPWDNLGFQVGEEASEAPYIAQASAEVVEEIVDAMALFSRRINYSRSPIRLRLAAAVLQDKDIRDALEDTIRTGLGRKLSFPDGSKQWTIGPRRRY